MATAASHAAPNQGLAERAREPSAYPQNPAQNACAGIPAAARTSRNGDGSELQTMSAVSMAANPLAAQTANRTPTPGASSRRSATVGQATRTFAASSSGDANSSSASSAVRPAPGVASMDSPITRNTKRSAANGAKAAIP